MDPIALEEDTPLEGGLKLLIQPCLVIMVLRGCQIRKKQIELRLGNALPVEEWTITSLSILGSALHTSLTKNRK